MRLEPAVPVDALAAIRSPFLTAGATPTDAAVLQPLSLLLDLSGEAMRARLFAVQGDGGEELCLRPDFTIPIARAHIAADAPQGRYHYEGKAFRVAPAGSLRAEEFLQIGLEAFGLARDATGKAAEDAEIIALAWRAAQAGGRGDLSLVLGDAALWGAFIDSLDLTPPLGARLKRAFGRPRLLKAELDAQDAPTADDGRLAALLADLPEDEAEGVLQELWAMAGIEPVGGRRPGDIAHRLAERARLKAAGRLSPQQARTVRDFLAVSDRPDAALDAVGRLSGPRPAGLEAALADWRLRLERLAALGVAQAEMTLATAFGRAFGYYDGLVFEVRSAALSAERPVAAGGRYDGLLGRLDGAAGGAVGCMVRPARAFAGGAE